MILSTVSICKGNIRYFLMLEYIICIHLKFDILFTRVFCTKYPRYQNANEQFLCKWIFSVMKKDQICWYYKYLKNQYLDIIIRQKTPLTTTNINTRIKHKRPCVKAFLWLLMLCNVNLRLQIIIACCLTHLIMCQW